nr:ABC transporter substrate-binding protein [Actinomycetota bacterium]
AAKSHDCSKGQNAGATEVGVTATEIRFAATVVTSGIARDFLAEAQVAMEAVRNKVNRRGGICGRRLVIDYKDDGWDSSVGQRYIESFIGEKKYFGLAVNPSSEGLRGAIDSGLIRNNKFPVIGSDGQLIGQYTDPWVWPVATSTASVMHVMAAHAYARGARTFGIVWDKKYRFGVEGHAAFVGAVTRLGGAVSSDRGVDGGQGDFANDAKTFMDGCGGTSFSKCDFVAMLLEPAPANSWVLRNGGLGDGRTHPRVGVGVPQPLFVNSFARDCKGYCAGMWAWTSFNPPIPPFDTQPAVAAYRTDLASQSSTADAANPHVQGAYVGMLLLVKALEALGPTPTREGMKRYLDSLNGPNAFETGLAPPMSFAPGNHHGNTGAQAFEDIVSGSDASASFANWRYTGSGFLLDKEVGKDVVE